MPQRLRRRHAFVVVDVETAADEVDHLRIAAAAHHVDEVARRRRAARSTALRRRPDEPRPAAVVVGHLYAVLRHAAGPDELSLALARRQHPTLRHADDLDDARQLVVLVLAGERRPPGVQLDEDAAEAPHVDRRAVPRAEDHLRRPVESRLDVRVRLLRLEAARPEVDDLNAAAAELAEEDVLRLEIAVDDVRAEEQRQTLEQRVRELADEVRSETAQLVLLDNLIEVEAEQFERNARVRAEREVVEHVNDVRLLVDVDPSEVLEDADLLDRLPVEALLVADHLQRHVLPLLVIVRLDDAAEASVSDRSDDLVAEGDLVVDDVDVRVFVVVEAVVVRRRRGATVRTSLGRRRSDVVDERVVEDLLVLDGREVPNVVPHR